MFLEDVLGKGVVVVVGVVDVVEMVGIVVVGVDAVEVVVVEVVEVLCAFKLKALIFACAVVGIIGPGDVCVSND